MGSLFLALACAVPSCRVHATSFLYTEKECHDLAYTDAEYDGWSEGTVYEPVASCQEAFAAECMKATPAPTSRTPSWDASQQLEAQRKECKEKWHCERNTDSVCSQIAIWEDIAADATPEEREAFRALAPRCPACDVRGIPLTMLILAAVGVAIPTVVGMQSVGPSGTQHRADQDPEANSADSDSEEEEEEIFERRSLSGWKEGAGGPWVISSAGMTLRSFMCVVARAALGEEAPAQLEHPRALKVRGVIQKAKLVPAILLAQPCWGGTLYAREGARAKWVRGDMWLIPLSTKELWWQQSKGLMRLQSEQTFGDVALRWLPQILTAIIGLSTVSLPTAAASIALGVLPAAIAQVHWRWMKESRAAAAKHRPALPEPQAIGNPAEAAPGLPGVPGGPACPSHTRITSWRDLCCRKAKPLLKLATYSANVVCLSVVMATTVLDLLLLGMYVLGMLTNLLRLARLVSRLASPWLCDPAAPTQGLRVRIQRMLTWLQERSRRTNRCCARIARAMEAYVALVSVVCSAAVLVNTTNRNAAALVAFVLLTPLADLVASDQREFEIATQDTSLVKDSIGEEGQKILGNELRTHGWVQRQGEFENHIREQVLRNQQLKKYESALHLMSSMQSMMDVIRVARDPRFLDRLAVLEEDNGTLHVGGLTRTGCLKLQANINYAEVTLQEKNSDHRREVPNGEDTRLTTRELIERKMDEVRTPGYVAVWVDLGVLRDAVEYVERFTLTDVNADGQPRPGRPDRPGLHKIQVVVSQGQEAVNRETLNVLNHSLDNILFEALGRGRRKPSLFVVGHERDFELYGPPTPEDEEDLRRVLMSL